MDRDKHISPRLTGTLLLLLLLAWVVAGCGGSGTGEGELPTASVRGIDNTDRGLTEGQLAPDFEIRYADGRRVKLSDYQGQPVLINFWATWCEPCKAEMPLLASAHDAHKDAGLVVLGVNADSASSGEKMQQRIDEFIAENALEFPIILDDRMEVQQLYTVRGLPTTIFVDPAGRVSSKWSGLLTQPVLDEYLAEIMPG